jgi:hypothetical protein
MPAGQIKTKLSDADILDLISEDMVNTRDYVEEISDLRTKDTNILRGMPYPGDQKRKEMGHSTVIAKVVANTVNWTQPGLVEIFSGDFFRFKLSNSSLSTDLKELVRKIWFRQQDGEKTVDDYVYDAQTQRTGGVLKIYYFEDWDLETESFDALLVSDMQELDNDPNVKITGFEENETIHPDGQRTIEYNNVRITERIEKFKGPRVENVDPARFGVSTDCISGDLKKARLVYQWSVKNIDYVRRMERSGLFRKGSVKKISDEGDYDDDFEGIVNATEEEIDNRYYVEDTTTPYEITDPSSSNNNEAKELEPSNQFRLYEIYTKLDLDGDGLLEPVIIKTSGNVIFSIERNTYGEPPFVLAQPFALPHQFLQQTYSVLLEEEQKIMTNLKRLEQDTAARSTYANPITDDKTLYAQLRKMKPMSVLNGNPDKIGYIQPPQNTQFILKAIELFQGDIENTSGVTRYNQGLDASSLNDTFGGMQLIMSASQQRQRLIARRLGWAFKEIIYRIVRILEMYPTEEFLELIERHAIESGGISIDDITIDVGVSFEEKFAISQQLAQLTGWQTEVGMQLGLVDTSDILNTIRKQYELVGVNTEGMLPTDEQYRERQQQQQQEQGAVPGGDVGAGLQAPPGQPSVPAPNQPPPGAV